MYLDREWIS